MLNKDVIYNENCLDTMRKMDNAIIDLIVTSPPYDDLRHYIGSELSRNYCDIANKRVPWIML